MKKVITYGTYDLLHKGHINLLRRAKELGDYLIVGVTTDSFDRERGKLNVRNNVLERVESVRRTGLADQIIIEEYVGQKIDDIQRYDIDVFAIGSDWKGKFDYLEEFCKVIYLDRTEGVSSSSLRCELQTSCNLGMIGTGRIAHKMANEIPFVNGVNLISVFNPVNNEAREFAEIRNIPNYFTSLTDFIETVDAVYVASPHLSHYGYIKESLEKRKHVLCEIPMVLSGNEAKELFNLAGQKELVLMEASKTAHFPAFNHLVALLKSGIVGEIIDIETSLSKLVKGNLRELDPNQAGGSMTELSSFPLLSIIKILGKDYKDIQFFTKMKNGIDIYTKGIIQYQKAIASFKLGLGMKSEGNLVVSGTNGYVYVPAPWWKTDYFEVRFEDQNMNKKYFYSYDGEGLRYEMQEFISMIANGRFSSHRLRRSESVVIADIIGKFRNGINVHTIE